MNRKPHRNTIVVEGAPVLAHTGHAGAQHIIRLHAPQIAQRALPGSFVHLQCDPYLPMRRPISIMRVDAKAGWVEFLYKVVGHGTQLLSQRKIGESLSLLGPIGVPFILHAERPRPLLIGGGVGIPPMVFMADHIRLHHPGFKPLVIMGSEVPFPFQTQPSKIMLPGIPDGVIACMPLLEDWGIASRLASLQAYPGCFDGYVTELARAWLNTLDPSQRQQVEIYSCGPQPMLAAVAKLAAEFALPCQVSLEEYMACAVGGCAGCTVKIQTPEGPYMKRVCVDGPVFDAYQVFGN
ncbi:MAG: dihydroorotate dehydrogenase electron transfer subunit [Gammaproteobacteria bacterium]|nr:dihydroorotate dehydrogenase electron transfer subunit [Gammaproteobacteria bacterium]